MGDQQRRDAADTVVGVEDNGPDDSEPTLERQAELRKVYESNLALSRPPYAGVVIQSRGELRWIIGERGWSSDDLTTSRDVVDLRGSGIRADLRDVTLCAANLSDAIIEGADFRGADLTGADLSRALIGGTDFRGANLTRANLSRVFVRRVDFSGANLDFADVSGAFVSGADLSGAELAGTNLSGALVGPADFSRANLTRARMDAATVFGGQGEEGAVRMDARTRLLDVSWNGAILALVNWNRLSRLGDEAAIKESSGRPRRERVQAYRSAARAYYGLAKALEAQGLIAPALRYRMRRHQLERGALLREFRVTSWMFSLSLNVVSGYGDRPGRALRVYLAVITAFAAVYFGVTNYGGAVFTSSSQPLRWYEALVFSVSSFHGRGFFPQLINLGDPIAVVAAAEAVIGLFIEAILIGTFTQRLFSR